MTKLPIPSSNLRLLRLFNVVSLVLGYTLSAGALAEPVMWKAKKGQTTLFIYGTIHVGSQQVTPLVPKVVDALAQSDSLIVEALLNENITLKQQKQVTVKQALDPIQSSELKTIATQSKLNYNALLDLPPWQAALTLQQVSFRQLNYLSDYGVDRQLMDWAASNHLPQIGLETLQFQIDLIAGQPDHGVDMLLQTIAEWPYNANNIQCLMNAWQAGDINKLESMMISGSYNEDFYQNFLVKRNRNWVEQLSTGEAYKTGTFFVAVGALHLAGSESVPHLLKQGGFTVNQITESKIANCSLKTND
ncbi:TraB/GumN family protein [Vibrio parahaemolyticus]|uniref:TraB/GumN family protein n=1 Tax=Vibrio mediterranei TaxID=689 RepID=UPI004067677D